MKTKRKRNLVAAVLSLIISLVFVAIGVYAYVNNYSVKFFGLIPLNWVAFAIIAVVLLTWSIWDIVLAVRERRLEQGSGTTDRPE